MVLFCNGCIGGDNKPAIGAFLDSPQSLRNIQRVIIVELADDKCSPEIAQSMTEAIFKAVQGKKLFHMDVISQTNPACRDLSLNKRERYDMKKLDFMRKELKCDAVLLGSVCHFQTYPRLQIGLNLLLLDLRAGKPVWAVAHTWDTTEKVVVERMKEFFSDQMREGYEPADYRMALMSPRTFQKFVAHEIAATMINDKRQ